MCIYPTHKLLWDGSWSKEGGSLCLAVLTVLTCWFHNKMIEEMSRPGQGSVVKLFHAIWITTSVTGCSFLAKQERVDAEVMNSHTRLTDQKLILDYDCDRSEAEKSGSQTTSECQCPRLSRYALKLVALFKMLAMFRNLTEGRSKREIKLLDDEDKQRNRCWTYLNLLYQ